MPGTPNLTQPVVIRALQALDATPGGWHTRAAVLDQIAVNADHGPPASVERALRQLTGLGTVVSRWDYPPNRNRRRVYRITPTTGKDPQ